jgi:peptide/nickel transport system substrate-binding protein
MNFQGSDVLTPHSLLQSKYSQCNFCSWSTNKMFLNSRPLGQTMLVKRLCFFVAIITSLLATSLTAANSAEVKVRQKNDFANIDPAFWQSEADLTMINVLFPKLIEFKSGNKWEWELSSAESIEQVDDLTIKFKLKPGLKWTNGYGEVTAEDVKYSYERYLDKELNSPNKGDWAPLDNVEVTGTYSGIIHLKEPFAPIWWSTLPFSSGAIVSKVATEEAGGKFTTEPYATAGMYKIESWKPRESTTLVPHNGWNGNKAAYDKIIILPITEPKAAEIAFEAGEIDVTDVAMSSVQNLKDSRPAGSNLQTLPSADYTWLGLNLANPKFSDIRIRQAIVKAVDVEAILEGAYFGVPERSKGLVAPGLLGHRESYVAPARDVIGAKALMKASGVSSLDLELELPNTTEFVTAAQIIQANLAEIGINVQINQLDSGAFWNVAADKKEALEMTLKNFTSPPDPSWSTQWFLSEQKAVWNWEWLQSEEFDNLHFAALKESNLAKRTAMYFRMQEIMDESQGFIWIMHPPRVVLSSGSVSPSLYPNGQLKLSEFKPN